MRFHYDAAGRLDDRRTARDAARYLRTFGGLISEIQRLLSREPVDLVVADFEIRCSSPGVCGAGGQS
jgi:hypothetical protein